MTICRPLLRYASSRSFCASCSNENSRMFLKISGSGWNVILVPRRSVTPVCLNSRRRDALGVLLVVDLAVAANLELEPVGQRVDRRHADAVQTAGDLVAAAAELAAGVEHGHHELGRRAVLDRVDADRNAAAVVLDRDRVVVVDDDVDARAVTGEVLVDRVVDDLVRPGGAGRVPSSVSPMYMPGRLRTPSSPFRTPIELIVVVRARKPANLLVGSAIRRRLPVEEHRGYHIRRACKKGIMCRISRGNLAISDAVIGPVSGEQNVASVGRRDEALTGLRARCSNRYCVARGIELARHVVEQQDRQVAVRSREHGELGGLPREHDRAQLALRRERAGVALVELEREVVAMRPELRRRASRGPSPGPRAVRARARRRRRGTGDLRDVARARREPGARDGRERRRELDAQLARRAARARSRSRAPSAASCAS